MAKIRKCVILSSHHPYRSPRTPDTIFCRVFGIHDFNEVFNSLGSHPPRSPYKGQEGPSTWHSPMVGTRLW